MLEYHKKIFIRKEIVFMLNIFKLKNEALDEAYEYFDKNIRILPKRKDGKVNMFSNGLVDNDVDAFRHAYVSGVFANELGVTEAKFYGFLREIIGGNGSSTNNSEAARNMDFWNNEVGRKYGKDAKNREQLLKTLHKALKEGELIIDLNDPRKHGKDLSFISDSKKPVILVEESKTGRNELFIDTLSGTIMDRSHFVRLIESDEYPGYQISMINNVPTPISKPDKITTNNLG